MINDKRHLEGIERRHGDFLSFLVDMGRHRGLNSEERRKLSIIADDIGDLIGTVRKHVDLPEKVPYGYTLDELRAVSAKAAEEGH